MIGTIIRAGQCGQYEVESKLGRGGCGDVFRARDCKTGEFVAIKLIREEDALDGSRQKTATSGPKHGYAIAELIHQRSDEVLRVEEGALYPALHRLELQGWLASEWGASENNRRAKFYRLTAAGRAHMVKERDHWSRLAAAVARVMETA